MSHLLAAAGQLTASALVVATLFVAVFTGVGLQGAVANPDPVDLVLSTQPQLDPEVTLPADFPNDFPIYPGSRPTEQIVLRSASNTSWLITWQTLDGVDAVQAYYSQRLRAGDWTISGEVIRVGAYNATFTRRTNRRFGGSVSIDGVARPGLVTISVVMATATT